MKGKYTLVLGTHVFSVALLLKIANFVFPSVTVWMCSCISTYILWICIAAITFKYTKEKYLTEKIEAQNRAVFITGCDSGFGNALARRLDSIGFHVFATCLFPEGEGATKLQASASNRLHILHVDVTQDESVEKAVEYVKENLGSSELWAIVNNAGIFKGFSVDFSTIDDFKDCINVNFLGTVRVTKAFLPLLKKTKGRIVNVTSIAGEVSFPFTTPYSASKYAAVGFTDCLRHEINRFGVSVISIEPEVFLTGMSSPKIMNNYLDMKLRNLDSSLKDEYGDDFKMWFKHLTKVALSFACSNISVVVNDMESAVSLVHPDNTYTPRRHILARFVCFTYEKMPRSCQIVLVKFGMSILYLKSKTLQKIVMKIISLV